MNKEENEIRQLCHDLQELACDINKYFEKGLKGVTKERHKHFMDLVGQRIRKIELIAKKYSFKKLNKEFKKYEEEFHKVFEKCLKSLKEEDFNKIKKWQEEEKAKGKTK